jgi:hypothetical protein
MTNDEIRDEVIALAPKLQRLVEVWQESLLRRLTLTSVGLAIGHGYWRRVTHAPTPLSVWISD